MKQILLIMIGLSTLYANFTNVGNDIVRDSDTRLEWQDDAVGGTIDWTAAINQCESLTLGGHSDWRLPNVNELRSLVDRSQVNPAIVTGFTNTSSNNNWSSTTYESNKLNAWYVNFSVGNVNYSNKGTNYYVRCVRDGQ